MGKSALDFDDIQAEENRRREVAVLAGASPRATKYEESELKEMIQEYIDERRPKVADRFAEYQKETALPGYNWVATEQDQKAAKQAKEDRRKLEDLVDEANKNEFKVTDTSTGRTKVEPVLTDEQKKEQEEREKRQKDQREKERQSEDEAQKNLPKPSESQKPSTQPSPTGSGDPRSASGVKK